MSVHVMSWVLRHSDETLGRRLVLLVIADHASEDGTQSWCSVSTLAREARLSRRATQDALRRLEASGAIVETGKGPRGTHEYRVAMGGAESAPGADLAPKPSLESKTPTSAVTHSGGVQGGWRVDKREVTTDEREIAQSILAEWNTQTGQSLRARGWLDKIVRRVRERPELTVAHHAHIIKVSLAHPWWRSTPSPSVIYGNETQFERQLTEAAKQTEGGAAGAYAVALAAIREARGEAS